MDDLRALLRVRVCVSNIRSFVTNFTKSVFVPLRREFDTTMTAGAATATLAALWLSTEAPSGRTKKRVCFSSGGRAFSVESGFEPD